MQQFRMYYKVVVGDWYEVQDAAWSYNDEELGTGSLHDWVSWSNHSDNGGKQSHGKRYTNRDNKLTFMYNEKHPFANMEVVGLIEQRLRIATEITLPLGTVNLVRVNGRWTDWLDCICTELQWQTCTFTKGLDGTHEASLHSTATNNRDMGNQPKEVVDELISVLNNYRSCISKDIRESGLTSSVEMDIKEIPSSWLVRAKT